MNQLRIDPGKLGMIHAMVQAEIGRPLTWKEFAQIAGVTPHTFSNIRRGNTGGSSETAEKVARAARKYGINVSIEDLTTEEPVTA